jgi:hypothetical protein
MSHRTHHKHDIHRLIAYLYTGAERAVVRSIGDDALGVVAKLSILHKSLLGSADSRHVIARFVLLDVDTSGTPTNAMSLIRSRNSPASHDKA